MDAISFKIKELISDSDKTYFLLSSYENELLPEASVANIIAVDKSMNLIWQAEPPTTKHDIYARIYLKEDRLFAVSSGGQLHQIDTVTGKIISSKMTK